MRGRPEGPHHCAGHPCAGAHRPLGSGCQQGNGEEAWGLYHLILTSESYKKTSLGLSGPQFLQPRSCLCYPLGCVCQGATGVLDLRHNPSSPPVPQGSRQGGGLAGVPRNRLALHEQAVLREAGGHPSSLPRASFTRTCGKYPSYRNHKSK